MKKARMIVNIAMTVVLLCLMAYTLVGETAHNEKNRAEGIRRYDVGVDANNFFPVSVKQVIDFFGEQVNIDDHNIV